MKKSGSVLVVVFSLFVSGLVLADDGTPYCESTYRDLGDGVASISSPLCNALWTQDVEANYILPAMSEMGMAHMSWTDTGMGNPITRVFNEEILDLSGYDRHIEYAPFEGDYVNYAVGTQITWGPGAAQDSCGFYLRSTAEGTFYLVEIDQYGNVELEEKDAGTWQTRQSAPTANLYTGMGATNTLMVMVLRDYFHIFVNGERVGSFSDSTNMDAPGGVGLEATTFDASAESYCWFEQAWIWPIDDWEWE